MAKGKHAAALFEVIHSGKRPEHAAGALRTPKWWFKGRPVQHNSAQAMEPEEPVTYVQPEPEPEPPLTAPRPQVSRRRTRMQSEGHPHELTMRMRFSTAVVGGFVLMILLGIAYVVGRHVAGGPDAATASSINPGSDLRQQSPVRGALDVPRRTARSTGASAPANGSQTPRHSDPVKPRDFVSMPAQGNLTQPQPVVEATGPREFGLNYILVMSYPPSEKDIAQQACDYLGKHGIQCTVEENDSLVKKGWYAVVTRKGWVKISEPSYGEYLDRIDRVADEFAKKTRSARFSPFAFKLK